MSYNVNLKKSERFYLQEYGLKFLSFLLENTPDPDQEVEVCVTYDVENDSEIEHFPNNIKVDLESFDTCNEFEDYNFSEISGINFTFKTPQTPKLLLPNSEKGIESLLKNDGFVKELGFGLSSSRPELRPFTYCFNRIRQDFRIGLERAYISFSEKVTHKDVKNIEMELVTFRQFMIGVVSRIEYYK